MEGQDLNRLLRQGFTEAATLMAALGVSQPTLSRLLKKGLDSGEVIRAGKARATRYGLRRPVPALPFLDHLPIYEIDQKGEAHPAGEIIPVYPEGTFVYGPVLPAVSREAFSLHSGLPFYLEYLRPEGFLGRALCKKIGLEGELTGDSRYWSQDQLLYFLYRYGNDLPGSFVVGRHSLERFLRTSYKAIPFTEVNREYHRLAEAVMEGDVPGSSAGGEQPKFTAYVEIESGRPPVHVIVKFSPTGEDGSVGRRWKDLLLAEHRALHLLYEAKLTQAPVDLQEIHGRFMLRIERFDRPGERGRRPWISIGSLDDELLGQRDHVRNSLRRLERMKLISPDDLNRGVVASLFGDFIGNTDQHFGNLSFSWDKDRLFLGPLYDILPMFYAPGRGGEINSERLHDFPVRMPEEGALYDQARVLAFDYWSSLAEEREISDHFRKIAIHSLEKMKAI